MVIVLETDILIQWKQRHLEKHLKTHDDRNVGFIYDGIVDIDEWSKTTKKRACFFLKEAYMKDVREETDLCEWLCNGNVIKLWHTVADWVYAVQNVTTNFIPAYTDIDSYELARIKSSAVVNIKKSNGTPVSNDADLMKYVTDDADLIQKQLYEIAPEIIVCGNTTYFLELVFGAKTDEKGLIVENANYNGFEIDHKELNRKGFYWAGDTLIIDFCHPANRFDRMGKYYAFAALYQQALKEKGCS